jgi:hypothetical protein
VHRHAVYAIALSVMAVLVTACLDPTGQSPRPGVSADVTPSCLPGCTETDPYPSWPGVFLSSAVTPAACGEGNDLDFDLLSDRCERDLSQAFAPELYYYNGDNVGREPYWVARPFNSTGSKVLIGYLLSYYRDEGSTAFLCTLPFTDPSCHGHNGDSEGIFLIVYYDATHKHWILDEARYSQHAYHAPYGRGTNLYPKMLTYPGPKLGSYPRAYVAEGKHANYASQRECNDGGRFGTDTCTHVNTAARVAWGGPYDLGSRAVHTDSQDCKVSRNISYIYYGSGRQECFWSGSDFRGWIPTTIGGGASASYSSELAYEGF